MYSTPSIVMHLYYTIQVYNVNRKTSVYLLRGILMMTDLMQLPYMKGIQTERRESH